MSELANIQQWLTSIIIKPGILQDKIRLADNFYGVDNTEAIRHTERLTSAEKIAIYAGGYLQRLLECLEAEFSVTHKLLGDELFHTFARAYLMHLPPTTPDLYNLGKNFPAFLKASQPQGGGGDTAIFDLPVDLALFERAIADVGRIEGLENKKLNESAESELLYLFNTSAIHTSPCLKLLQLRFPLIDMVKAVYREKDFEVPELQESFVAITRKNYRVNFNEFEPWQWHFLNALQSTDSYVEAIEETSAVTGIAADVIMADLVLWMPMALGLGYVYMG